MYRGYNPTYNWQGAHLVGNLSVGTQLGAGSCRKDDHHPRGLMGFLPLRKSKQDA